MPPRRAAVGWQEVGVLYGAEQRPLPNAGKSSYERSLGWEREAMLDVRTAWGATASERAFRLAVLSSLKHYGVEIGVYTLLLVAYLFHRSVRGLWTFAALLFARTEGDRGFWVVMSEGRKFDLLR